MTCEGHYRTIILGTPYVVGGPALTPNNTHTIASTQSAGSWTRTVADGFNWPHLRLQLASLAAVYTVQRPVCLQGASIVQTSIGIRTRSYCENTVAVEGLIRLIV